MLYPRLCQYQHTLYVTNSSVIGDQLLSSKIDLFSSPLRGASFLRTTSRVLPKNYTLNPKFSPLELSLSGYVILHHGQPVVFRREHLSDQAIAEKKCSNIMEIINSVFCEHSERRRKVILSRPIVSVESPIRHSIGHPDNCPSNSISVQTLLSNISEF